MKLQNMGIIFVIIILPVILILSAYIRLQINTITIQTAYDTMLTDAVYDSIKAYQINTTNNSFSAIKGSQKRDIEASMETFMTSLNTRMGVGGYRKDYIKPFIPAVLNTLYDGYYIYTPTLDEGTGVYQHMLRPFNNYSVRYKKGLTDIMVCYTLDNQITITGSVNGTYVNKSGYLLNNTVAYNEEDLREGLYMNDLEAVVEFPYVFYKGENKYYNESTGKWFLYGRGVAYPFTATSDGVNLIPGVSTFNLKDENAKQYAEDGIAFTDWVYANLRDITIGDAVLLEDEKKYDIYGNGSERIFDRDVNVFADEDSNFNVHKRDMMKIILQKELSSAIANYNAHSGALRNNT